MERWPMVGRAEEQAYLADVIADPQQRGVLIAGRAGVGKTRLVREVLAATPDCRAEFLTATESARGLPFGALARVLPETVSGIDRVDLLPVISRHLVAGGEGRPIVLAVDDVHLLDELSCAFVHHFATAGLGTVLLTMRSGEPAPDAVMALHRDEIIDRLELQAISRAEFDELVEMVLGGPTEGATRDRLWTVTQGNALFVRELVGDALDAGTLQRDHGVWRWMGGVGAAPRLRETITGRLRDLSGPERAVVELLAVGEPLSVIAAEDLAPSVSVPDLERRGVVTVEADGRRTSVRLAHPLFGEVVRGALPLSVHRAIHRDLAKYVADLGARRHGDPLQLALWQEAAGEPSDPTLLAAAAGRANALSDCALAERLARAAADAGGGFRALLELGRALHGQSRFAESEAVLTPLLGDAPTDDDRERVVDTLVQAVGWGLGRIDDGLEILVSAERDVLDPAMKALLQAYRATLLMYAARFGEAAELGAAALAVVDDESVRIRSLAPIGVSLAMSGRIEEALTLTDQSLEPALRLQDRFPRAPAWALMTRAAARFFAGRFERDTRLVEVATSAVANPTPAIRAQAHAFGGRYALAQGRALTAGRLLDDAAVTIRDDQSEVPASWCLALAAEAHALLGRHDHAAELAAEATGFARTQVVLFEPDELRALAWVDAQAGRTSSAVDRLWAGADLAADRGQRAWEVIVLDDLLRLGERRAAERTRKVADLVDGAWARAIGLHACAVLSGDTVDLEAAADAFAAIGCSLIAAELWAAASAGRQRDSLPARAAHAARRSRSLVEECEGARTQPLAQAVSPVPLSRREREIARLAAAGASNGQIARELSLSVRTVESHLYSTFAKLGVTQRHQLNAVLHDE